MKNSTAIKFLLLTAALIAVVCYVILGTDVDVVVKALAVLAMFGGLIVLALRMGKTWNEQSASRDQLPQPPDRLPDWGLVTLGIVFLAAQLLAPIFSDRPYWVGLLSAAISTGTWIGVIFLMERFVKFRDPVSQALDASWRRALVAIFMMGLAMTVFSLAIELLRGIPELHAPDTNFGLSNMYFSWTTAACLNVLLKRRRASKQHAEPLQASAPSQ